MTPVNLSREIALEERRTVPDGLGGYSEAWTGVGLLWAEIVAGAGRDMPGEEITLSSVPYRITVRGAPIGSAARPRPDQRFRDGPRAYRIVAVTERDRYGHYLLCFARQEVPS
jgi:head-tail adaptor